ncbi:MAG: S8 family serine peptidase, partial [Deltaproteobacteria bacterium]
MVRETKSTHGMFALVLCVALSVGSPLRAVSVLENIEDLRKFFGLTSFQYRPELAKLKIAVIDNGFEGFESGKKQLPESAELISAYPKEMVTQFNLGDPDYVQAPLPTEHGKMMAQIVWGITGANPQGPKFYLLNANGITNFRRAVRFAIEQKVDLILYSQNRECCGNFDGGGFINAIVNQATQSGIVWINAAGNYGGHVFNSAIQSMGSDNRVVFVKANELRLRSRLDENKAQIIMAWGANGPEEDSGTDQDLDLYVYDENNTQVAKSELKQVMKKDSLAEGETYLARERISYDFSKNRNGYYRIVVKAKNKNWNRNNQVRIVVIPERPPIQDNEKQKMVDAIEFLDATKGGEIMVPADNPNVITVGDMSPFSAQGPTSDGRVKPEIILENSIASFSNGQSSSGTSNAAAYFTGIAAILKSYAPHLTREQLIGFPKKRPSALGASIRRVPFTEFVSQHSVIFNSIEQMLDESPILAGRYSDGRYVIGIRKSPAETLQRLCEIN